MKRNIIPLILQQFIFELLLIILMVFVVVNHISPVKENVRADGVGYYDYLPSIFIHSDLVRKDKPKDEFPELYTRINRTNGYVPYNNKYMVNKYPCGTAVLELPFFAGAYLTTGSFDDKSHNGYQQPFQKAVFISTLFYLLLSLIFLKKLFKLYHIKGSIIVFLQVLIVFATPVLYYSTFESSFSHIYSLFGITASLYSIKKFFITKQMNYFLMFSLLLGLIFILRQINIVVILFFPFLAGSIEEIKNGVRILLKEYKKFIVGVFLFFAVFFIQSLMWYLQTGTFILFSYQGEGFDFLNPHFIDILFSYQKGLFVYTPLLLSIFVALLWFLFRKEYYMVLTWLVFFVPVTYLFSSWGSWSYGASFGLRAYIEFFGIFFLPVAMMMNKLSLKFVLPLAFVMLLTVPVNIIQTYQYKKFILHWYLMDKDKYWKVFLKTAERYDGLLWKKKINTDEYKIVKEINVGDVTVDKNSKDVLCKVYSSDIPDFNKVRIVQVLIDQDFEPDNRTVIALWFKDAEKGTLYYSDVVYLLRYHEKKLNEWQTGLFNYTVRPFKYEKDKMIVLYGRTSKDQLCHLSNVRVKFLAEK